MQLNLLFSNAKHRLYGLFLLLSGGIPAQAQQLQTGALDRSAFCAADSVYVPYTVDNDFQSGNIFEARLSDENGSFSNSTLIGSIQDVSSGTVPARLPTLLPAGTQYRIRVVATATAVNGSDNGTDISIKGLPKITATASATTVCAGDSVTLKALVGLSMDPYTFSWDNNVTDKKAFVPTATRLYTVSALAGNCRNTDTITVTVKALPKITASASATTVCAGDSVTLKALVGLSMDPYTFSWDNNVTDKKAFVPTATKLYTVSALAGNCRNKDTITVTVKALPKITASASATTVCAGDSVTLKALVGLSMDPYTFSWDNNVTDKKAFVPTATKLYTVSALAGNCRNKDTITVTVKPLPKVSASASDSSVCEGESVTLKALVGISIDPYTISWDNNVTDNKAFVPAATQKYTVTAVSGNCSKKDTLTITVWPLPKVSANATASRICKGNSVTLSGQGAATYVWDNNVSDNVPFNPTATVTYKVKGTDTRGCSNTAEIGVVVDLPVSTETEEAICAGSFYELGKQKLEKAGVYTEVFAAANGCDSTVTLTLSVTTLDKNLVADTLKGLIAVEDMDSYQWLDCDKDNSIIEGAIQAVYKPVQSGRYAVVLVHGDCRDTSACMAYEVQKSSVGDLPVSYTGMQMYPNPAGDRLFLGFDKALGKATVRLLNMVGQSLLQLDFVSGAATQLDLARIPAGIYIVDVSTDQVCYRARIVKE